MESQLLSDNDHTTWYPDMTLSVNDPVIAEDYVAFANLEVEPDISNTTLEQLSYSCPTYQSHVISGPEDAYESL